MKQHITIEQLNELSDKAKEKLREWWEPEEYPFYDDEREMQDLYEMFPLMSIGQMIEFLDYHNRQPQLNFALVDTLHTGKLFPPDFMCDALWEAVKLVLEENDKKDETPQTNHGLLFPLL